MDDELNNILTSTKININNLKKLVQIGKEKD